MFSELLWQHSLDFIISVVCTLNYILLKIIKYNPYSKKHANTKLLAIMNDIVFCFLRLCNFCSFFLSSSFTSSSFVSSLSRCSIVSNFALSFFSITSTLCSEPFRDSSTFCIFVIIVSFSDIVFAQMRVSLLCHEKTFNDISTWPLLVTTQSEVHVLLRSPIPAGNKMALPKDVNLMLLYTDIFS